MHDDLVAAVRPWIHYPVAKARLELTALALCFVIHPYNNNFRKLTLLALTGVWSLVTLGVSTGPQFGSVEYTILTALVFAIIGRQWGIEISGMTPRISISPTESDDDE